jgi:hypothetical protein
MSAPPRSRHIKFIQSANLRHQDIVSDAEYEKTVQGLNCPWLGRIKENIPTIPAEQLKKGSLYIYHSPDLGGGFAGYILGRVVNTTDQCVRFHNLWYRRYRQPDQPGIYRNWEKIDGLLLTRHHKTITSRDYEKFVFFDLASLGTTQYNLFNEHIKSTDPETICEMYKELATVHEQVKRTLSKRNPQAFQTDGTLKHIFDYVGGKRSTKGRRKKTTTGLCLSVKNRTQRKNRGT